MLVVVFQPADCSGTRASLATLNKWDSMDSVSVQGVLIEADGLSDMDVEAISDAAELEFPITREKATTWTKLVTAAGYTRTPIFLRYHDGMLVAATGELRRFLEIIP